MPVLCQPRLILRGQVVDAVEQDRRLRRVGKRRSDRNQEHPVAFLRSLERNGVNLPRRNGPRLAGAVALPTDEIDHAAFDDEDRLLADMGMAADSR